MERIKRAFALQLDFAETGHKSTNIKFKQYDYGANEIGIQILFDKEIVQLDDEIIIGVFKDVEGKIYTDVYNMPVQSYGLIVDNDLGLITLPILKELVEKDGKVIGEIVVASKDGMNRLTSQSFDFEVVPSIFDLKDVEQEVEV